MWKLKKKNPLTESNVILIIFVECKIAYIVRENKIRFSTYVLKIQLPSFLYIMNIM